MTVRIILHLVHLERGLALDQYDLLVVIDQTRLLWPYERCTLVGRLNVSVERFLLAVRSRLLAEGIFTDRFGDVLGRFVVGSRHEHLHASIGEEIFLALLLVSTGQSREALDDEHEAAFIACNRSDCGFNRFELAEMLELIEEEKDLKNLVRLRHSTLQDGHGLLEEQPHERRDYLQVVGADAQIYCRGIAAQVVNGKIRS